MPAPTTPVGPALASESLANSMDPGIAKAVGIGYLASTDADAAVIQVTPEEPFPVTVVSGGQTDALTNAELRASPVPVIIAAYSPSAIVTEFTSTTSQQIYAADAGRVAAIVFVPEESAALHIRWGSADVSAADRSYTIQPGGAYQVPQDFAAIELRGIMSSAGNAFITQFTTSDPP